MERSKTPGLCFKLVAALAVVAAGGCATTTSFRMSTVVPTKAAIAGHLKIIYDGKIFTENCHVTFSGHQFNLKADGIVLLSIEKGWASLEEVACLRAGIVMREAFQPGSGSGTRLSIRGAHLFARGEGTVTDFGDVTITWGFRSVARVDVGPPVAEVRAAFRRQTGADGRWVVSLVSQPKFRVEEPSLGNVLPCDRQRPAPGANPPSCDDHGAPRLAGSRGFFCTSSSPTQGAASFCERTQAGCEHVRSVLTTRGMGACHAAETAWCFVTDGLLRCSETAAACFSARERTVRADQCGEQY